MIRHRTRDAVAAGYLEPIVDELTRAFDGAYPVADLYRETERAMAELSGSISLEALPEMVIRLVWVRLVTNGVPAVTAPAITAGGPERHRVGSS
jgi:hypothetical protein